MAVLCSILTSSSIFSVVEYDDEGVGDTIWGRHIIRSDGFAFYRAKKKSTDGSKNVTFLTQCLRLYNDKILADNVMNSMLKILDQTQHLQENYQKRSKSFEVVLGLPNLEASRGNRPMVLSYIFNVETEMVTWPGRGVNIWSDLTIGTRGFRCDRLADIGM